MVDLTLILKLVLVIVFSGLIGYEREHVKKQAGLRTHILVCLSCCIITISSVIYFPQETARIIAGLLTGMGFIGAGAIIAEQQKVIGITTATSLWFVAIIGIIIALGAYEIATISIIVAFLILQLKRLESIKKTKP